MLVSYRIYAEDGAILSKTPFESGVLFLGRIKVRSVPPPRTVKAVKGDDTEKVAILNGTGRGSTPQEPLALVTKMPDSERSALESDGRVELVNAAEANTTPLEIRYGTSLQHSPTFLFVTVEGSVLSALRRRL